MSVMLIIIPIIFLSFSLLQVAKFNHYFVNQVDYLVTLLLMMSYSFLNSQMRTSARLGHTAATRMPHVLIQWDLTLVHVTQASKEMDSLVPVSNCIVAISLPTHCSA